MKKIISIILAVIIAASTITVFATSANAATESKPFEIYATSNFFPDKYIVYNDMDSFKDENGDIFVTVEYKINVPEYKSVNFHTILTWDEKVLEYKEAYNMETFNGKTLYQPFTFLIGEGGLMVNTFDDSNMGRMVAVYTDIRTTADLYEEDEYGNSRPVRFMKAVFKVIDKNAVKTNVDFNVCEFTVMSSDIECSSSPKYDVKLVNSEEEIVEKNKDLYTLDVSITPQGEEGLPVPTQPDEPDEPATGSPTDENDHIIGDINDDGVVDVLDAAQVQKYAADKTDFSSLEKSIADVNDDGNVDVLDAAEIQKYSSDKLPGFKRTDI